MTLIECKRSVFIRETGIKSLMGTDLGIRKCYALVICITEERW